MFVYTFSNIESLIIYIIIYFTSAEIFVRFNKKQYSLLVELLIVSIIPAIFGAVRYAGTDYPAYLSAFKTAKDINLFQYFKTTDIINDGTTIGIAVVAHIAKLFSHSANVYFGILTALTYVPVAYFVKKRFDNEYHFLIILNYLFGNFSSDFNIVKQGIAMSLIVLSFDFVLDRKIIHFLVTILFAFLFHPSALVAIPIYFLLDKKGKLQSWKIIIVLIIVTIFVVNFSNILISLESERYSGYATSNFMTKNLTFYLNALWLLVFLIFSKKLISLNENNRLYILIYSIAVLLNLIGFVSVYGKRIGGYFSIVSMFLLAQLPKCVEKYSIKLLNGCVIVYTVGLFIY